MKKLIALLIIFQLTSCGGINITDIPLENVTEHTRIIYENSENKKALEKAYVELSEANDQIWESPYIYYYLSLIYEDGYQSLFDLDPLEAGLTIFPNDPFLNNIKVNRETDLDTRLEAYKNILENHPRFVSALININTNYYKYWKEIENDEDLVLEKEKVQDILKVVDLYENGENNTSEYYDFNEIFSDTIVFNFSAETIKSYFEDAIIKIEAAEERIIRERNNGYVGPTKINIFCYLGDCEGQFVAEEIIKDMRKNKFNPFGFEFFREFEDEYGNPYKLRVGKRVIPSREYYDEVNKFYKGSDIYDVGRLDYGTASPAGRKLFNKLYPCVGYNARGVQNPNYYLKSSNQICEVNL